MGSPARLAVTVMLGLLAMGCASKPVITKEIYQDRSMWIRLEKNPYVQPAAGTVRSEEETSITSAALAAWLKGFRVLTERGIVGMAAGKNATNQAFVEQEIFALTPHLAKGLAMAKPDERVAYCFVADRNQEERYITTAFLYAQTPYLYYKLEEYRALVRVPNLSASTSEACQTKPQPGYKTADRYFRLEYEPENFVVGYGLPEKFGSFMAGIVENRRGEVVFKLSSLIPPKKPAAPGRPEPVGQIDPNSKIELAGIAPTPLPGTQPVASGVPPSIQPAKPSEGQPAKENGKGISPVGKKKKRSVQPQKESARVPAQ